MRNLSTKQAQSLEAILSAIDELFDARRNKKAELLRTEGKLYKARLVAKPHVKKVWANARRRATRLATKTGTEHRAILSRSDWVKAYRIKIEPGTASDFELAELERSKAGPPLAMKKLVHAVAVVSKPDHPVSGEPWMRELRRWLRPDNLPRGKSPKTQFSRAVFYALLNTDLNTEQPEHRPNGWQILQTTAEQIRKLLNKPAKALNDLLADVVYPFSDLLDMIGCGADTLRQNADQAGVRKRGRGERSVFTKEEAIKILDHIVLHSTTKKFKDNANVALDQIRKKPD